MKLHKEIWCPYKKWDFVLWPTSPVLRVASALCHPLFTPTFLFLWSHLDISFFWLSTNLMETNFCNVFNKVKSYFFNNAFRKIIFEKDTFLRNYKK